MGFCKVGAVMVAGFPENMRPLRDTVLSVTCYDTRNNLDLLGTITIGKTEICAFPIYLIIPQ